MKHRPSASVLSLAIVACLIFAPSEPALAQDAQPAGAASLEAPQASSALRQACRTLSAPLSDLATLAMNQVSLAVQCQRNRSKSVTSDKDMCGTGQNGECTDADFSTLLQAAYTEAVGKCSNQPAVTCAKASCLQDCVLAVSYTQNTNVQVDARCFRNLRERCFLSLGGVCECTCPAANPFAVSLDLLGDVVLEPRLERLPSRRLELPEPSAPPAGEGLD